MPLPAASNPFSLLLAGLPTFHSGFSTSILGLRGESDYIIEMLSGLRKGTSLLRSLPTNSLPSLAQIPSYYGSQHRGLATLLDLHDDLDSWPRSKPNTILNVCNQGEKMVIERLGKLHDIKEGGWFISIPLIDQIRYVIDMREKALAISPQACITKDNVSVHVSGNLYCQFTDAERAAYGSKNPVYAVKQAAMASMRAAIGEMELDQILRARAELNTIIREAVQDAASAWGLEIKRYEITEVNPEKNITEAMGRQAAAERERRSVVLEAEGKKRAAELESEGEKIRIINQSEGEKVRITNAAEALKIQLELEAQGESFAIEQKALAQARAIESMASSLNKEAGMGYTAAQMNIARNYIDMYSQIGSQSNTMIFNDKPADINALLAQAKAVMSIDTTAMPKNTSSDAHKIE